MIPTHYKIIAGLIGLSIISGFYANLYISREKLRTELAETKGQLETSRMANNIWVENSKRTNEAVERMQIEAEAMAKALKDAQIKAVTAAEVYEANACTLMAQKPSGEACEAAHDMIVKFMEGRK